MERVTLGLWLQPARQIGIEDHPSIVIDEIAGYVVAMTMIPLTWWTVTAGFLIFRLLDIYKPPPASWLDRNCTGGFGITAEIISSLKKADGLVIGSALSKEISKSIKKKQNPVKNVGSMVKKLSTKFS